MANSLILATWAPLMQMRGRADDRNTTVPYGSGLGTARDGHSH